MEWSSHEPEYGMYDFSGMKNLTHFLTIAQEEDLVVILRLGPYMDAERDMVRQTVRDFFDFGVKGVCHMNRILL